MEKVILIVFFILSVICGILVDVFYHKLFDVTYFGCRPLITEWLVCWFIGAGIVYLPFEFLGLTVYLPS